VCANQESADVLAVSCDASARGLGETVAAGRWEIAVPCAFDNVSG
jgi:hypothetical protein